MAISNLSLSLVLVRHIGIAGPVWGSVISQTIVVLVPAGSSTSPGCAAHLRDPRPCTPPGGTMTSSPTRALRASGPATALTTAIVREVGGANRALVRRPLVGLRRLAVRAGDPAIRYTLDGTDLLLPLSHDLPMHRARYPRYSANLGDVAAAVAAARPEATMVDIGANIGDSVAIAAAPFPHRRALRRGRPGLSCRSCARKGPARRGDRAVLRGVGRHRPLPSGGRLLGRTACSWTPANLDVDPGPFPAPTSSPTIRGGSPGRRCSRSTPTATTPASSTQPHRCSPTATRCCSSS